LHNHRRFPRKLLYVYPVISRRSRGLSIGVNLSPAKTCNFRCVYCDSDRAARPRAYRVDLQVIEAELRATLLSWKNGTLFDDPRLASVPKHLRRLNDIAISGDGEPTLCPKFEKVVRLVAQLKQKLCPPAVKLVLITNASRLHVPSVQQGLKVLDASNGEIWAKLDAGTPSHFKILNRSWGVTFSRVAANLIQTAHIRPLVIQTMACAIRGRPPSARNLDGYTRVLNGILEAGGRVRDVHLYTVSRATAEPWVTPLTKWQLKKIAARIHRATGLKVSVFPSTL